MWGWLGVLREVLYFRRRTPLGRYLRDWQRYGTASSAAAAPGHPRGSAAKGGLFPCACPPKRLRGPCPSGGRRAQRWHLRRAAEEFVLLQFGVGCYLAQGRFLPGPRVHRWTTAHEAAWRRGVEAALRFVRLSRSVELGSGRRGPEITKSLGALRAWEHSVPPGLGGAGYGVHSGPKGGPGAAVRLVARRVALPGPGEAGSFDPRPYMNPAVRLAYEDPSTLWIDDAAARAGGRRVRLLRLSPEWLATAARLDDVRMLGLAPLADVSRAEDGTILAANFVCVSKDEDWDRAIVNRIPTNDRERRVDCLSGFFPHGCSLCEVALKEHEELVVAVDDQPNFYHKFGVSRKRARSNVVGRPVPTSVARARFPHAWGRMSCAEQAQATADGHVATLWNAMPMGDGNAVSFAQHAHAGVLVQGGAFREESRIVYPGPWPRGAVAEGLCIDDYAVFERAPFGTVRPAMGAVHRDSDPVMLDQLTREEQQRLSPGEERLRLAHVALVAAGLPPKISKAVRRARRANVWGGYVDGVRGIARARLDGTWRAIILSLELLRSRRLSFDLWDTALGLWSNSLLYQREGYSFLYDAYRVRSRAGVGADEAGAVGRVRASAAEELLMLCIFAPLLETDLRAPFAPEWSCTDASSCCAASVVARVPVEVSAEMWRWREKRRGYSRSGPDWLTMRAAVETERDVAIVAGAEALLSDVALAELREWDEAEARAGRAPTSPWLEDLAKSSQWRQALRFGVHRDEHINKKETKAYAAEKRRLAANVATQGQRRMFGLDSSVTIGAASKGRSSTYDVNAVLRRSAPDAMLGGIQAGHGHLRSATNPADDPTRGRALRSPTAGEPSWVAELVAGDEVALEREFPQLARVVARRVVQPLQTTRPRAACRGQSDSSRASDP